MTNGIKWHERFTVYISFHFMPLVMCVFYFQSKFDLKVSTHITNGTVIINSMYTMYYSRNVYIESYVL